MDGCFIVWDRTITWNQTWNQISWNSDILWRFDIIWYRIQHHHNKGKLLIKFDNNKTPHTSQSRGSYRAPFVMSYLGIPPISNVHFKIKTRSICDVWVWAKYVIYYNCEISNNWENVRKLPHGFWCRVFIYFHTHHTSWLDHGIEFGRALMKTIECWEWSNVAIVSDINMKRNRLTNRKTIETWGHHACFVKLQWT